MMKNKKWVFIIATILCIVAIVAFAASYTRSINTSILIDGKLYSNKTNFTWEMEAPISQPFTLSFTTVDENGTPIDGATFLLLDADDQPISAISGTSVGVFTYENLLPGEYTLVETVAPVGYELPNNSSWTVSVAENGEVTVVGDDFDASNNTITNVFIKGIEWDGTSTFIYVTYPEPDEIIEAPDGLRYIDGQLIFSAQRLDSIGAEFEQVKQLMSQYGIRIIGYIAPTASYQVEVVSAVPYSDLLKLRDQIDSESIIVSGTTNLSYVETVSQNVTISAQYDFGDGMTNDRRLWNGDELNANLPDGKNWGMEYIKAVAAWKYMPLTYDIACSVWDGGYRLHDDLDIVPLLLNNTPTDEDDVNHGTHVAGIMAANHDAIGVSGVFDTDYLYAIPNKTTTTGIEGILDRQFAFADLACLTMSVVRTEGDSIDTPVVINRSMGRGLYLTGAEEPDDEEEKIQREETIKKIRCAWALQNGQTIEEDWFDNMVANWESQDLHYADDINDLANQGWKFLIVQTSGNAFDSHYSPVTSTIDCKYNHPLCSITGPASDHVIVVGAIGWNGTALHASFSSAGDRVDTLAPGVDIWSTFSREHYAYGSGTSMAAPHVAGTAAFVWSIDPEFSAEQVKRLTLTTYRYIEKRDDDTVRSASKGDYPLLNTLAAVEAAISEARPAAITGTVHTEEGNLDIVTPNAQVILFKDGIELDRTVSETNGVFSFSELVPGIYTIVVVKEGYEQYETANIYLKANATSTVNVYLTAIQSAKVEVTGTVIDTTDSPLKGVTVSIKDNSMVSTTDENGGYLFELPVGTYTLVFEKTGYQTAEKEITIETDDVGWTFIVDAVVLSEESTNPGTITGKVTDENGIPLYHVNVQLWGATEETQTDWDGNFSIEIPAGFASLNFTKNGYSDTRKSVTVTADQTSDIGTIKMSFDPTLPYVSLTTQTVDYQTQYTVTVRNPELKQVDKIDIKLVHNGIIYVDTANGISTDCQINGTNATFTWDEELIHGASLYVTISGSSWSQEYNCIMVAGSTGVERLPIND